MFIVGLTGSIGSGKTEAASVLAFRGAQIIDADHEAHSIYAPGTKVQLEIIKLAGKQVLSDDGSISRSGLGREMIKKPALRSQINNLLHPLIRERIEQKIKALRDASTCTLIVQVPLLFQVKWDDLFDEIWAITTSEDIAIARITHNRGVDPVDAKSWLAAQGNPKDFTENADVIIENELSLSEFKAKIEKIWVERTPFKGQYDK